MIDNNYAGLSVKKQLLILELASSSYHYKAIMNDDGDSKFNK